MKGREGGERERGREGGIRTIRRKDIKIIM